VLDGALNAVKQFHHKAGNTGGQSAGFRATLRSTFEGFGGGMLVALAEFVGYAGFSSRSHQCTFLVVGLRPSLLLVLHFLPQILRVLGRFV
jgi:hypothetical protein